MPMMTQGELAHEVSSVRVEEVTDPHMTVIDPVYLLLPWLVKPHAGHSHLAGGPSMIRFAE